MNSVSKKLRILDWDIENRPLSYLGGDWTTAEVTAIAASWGSRSAIWTGILGRDDPVDILEGFRYLYDEADIITGHYIRRHDLPIVNGAMMEYGLKPLGPKMTSDTKLDLVRRKDLSASQESLSEMLGITRRKVHMSQNDWREANRLERIDLTEKRVKGDVRQHQLLRKRLVELGLLGPPRMWQPTTRGY